MRSQFASVIEALTSLIEADDEFAGPEQAPEPEQEVAAVEMVIDGCDVTLLHPTPDASRIKVYCRFGPAPDEVLPDALFRLLEINLALADAGAGALGVDGESRDVVFYFTVDLAATSAQALLRALRHAAGQAACWRADGFVRGDRAAWTMPAGNFAEFA